MMRVQKSQLGPSTLIGEGSYGRVYRVGQRMPSLSPASLAYKELLPTLDRQTADVVRRGMEIAVALRDTFTDVERDELDQLTAWPLAVVEERGQTVGTVMALLPDDFFVPMNLKGAPKPEVFELQYLCASDDYARLIGLDRSAVEADVMRLALAARLAYTIHLLHDKQIVYGDLSLRNVAIAGDPQRRRFATPRTILLDCDAVALLSDAHRIQGHSFAFWPPEINDGSQALQDLQTDVYKLGLCVVRMLAKGPSATQLADPRTVAGPLGPQGVDLIERALGRDRNDRPTASDLWRYLDGRVATLTRPPELTSATLNRSVLIRGSDAIVTWSQRYGAKLRIFGVNGFEVSGIDPDAHPHGYAIQPPTAGPIFVEVTNRFGAVCQRAGFLDYLDLPELDLEEQLRGVLPRLRVPDLPVVPIPHVPAPHVSIQPPPRPMVSTNGRPPPKVGLPAIAPHLTELRAATVVAGGAGVGSVLAKAHRQASHRVGEVLSHGLRTLLMEINAKVRVRSMATADDFDSDGADRT